ncbi:MAG: ion transporter [Gammaproteobacteria bacterium]
MQNIVNKVRAFRDAPLFNVVVIGVIVFSAIYAGVSSYDLDTRFEPIISVLDYAITIFFLVEIIIRIFAEKSLKDFLKDGWNIFDTLIVCLSLIPVGGSETIFVARLLRIVRVLRIITVVPEFRGIIESLIQSLPRVSFIALLLFIFMYIWAAIGTMFFESIDPDRWGDIGKALTTLTQVATYDDWGAIMKVLSSHYFWVPLYFISYIIINAVILLNMVIGVIVEVMIRNKDLN